MLHSWDDDNDEYEALGLRVLLRQAVSKEEYAKATTEHCIKLGIEEHRRVSQLGHERWMRTFKELTQKLGRPPSGKEHREAMIMAQKVEESGGRNGEPRPPSSV